MIYYKELAHTIMEADKSHKLWSIGSRGSGVNSSLISNPWEPGATMMLSFSPKAEDLCLSSYSQVGRENSTFLNFFFLFYSGPQQFG